MNDKKYILADNEEEEGQEPFEKHILEKIKALEISLQSLKQEISNISSALEDKDESFFEGLDIPGREFDEDWYTNHGHGD